MQGEGPTRAPARLGTGIGGRSRTGQSAQPASVLTGFVDRLIDTALVSFYLPRHTSLGALSLRLFCFVALVGSRLVLSPLRQRTLFVACLSSACG